MIDPSQHDASLAEEARYWVVRLASGAMTEAEMARFKAWIAADAGHEAAFEQARALWQRAEAVQDVFTPRSAHVLPWHRRTQPRLAAAAALAAALVLALFADDVRIAVKADYATATGTQRVVQLADGSTVTLNTDSAIALDFTAGQRRIELLRGEAFFEVAHDSERPFRVFAQDGVTQAIGTAFTVREDAARGETPDRVTVSMAEGTVTVTSPMDAAAPTTAALTAKAGDRVTYRKGEPPWLAGKIAEAAPWRQGRIVMEGTPFAEAVAELDRYRPGRILLLGDSSRYRPVSGVFSTDRLDEALAGLAATQGLTATRLTDYLVVLR